MTSYAAKANFGNYTPSSFGWRARDPEKNPSLLTNFTFDGVSFGSMHRDVHGLFTALLTELVPHIPGGLKANTCGCYNPGSVTVGGDRSFHTYAIAIDVNWGANPMYAKAHPTGKYALPEITSSIARKYGCEWGGDWSYPQDWMHLECHLTPAAARTVKPATPTAPAPKEFTVDAAAKARFDRIDSTLDRIQKHESALAVAVESFDNRMTSLVLHGDAKHPNSLDSIMERVDALAAEVAALKTPKAGQ